MTVRQVMMGVGGRAPVVLCNAEPGTSIKKDMMAIPADDPAVLDLPAVSTHVERIGGRDTLVIGVNFSAIYSRPQ